MIKKYVKTFTVEWNQEEEKTEEWHPIVEKYDDNTLVLYDGVGIIYNDRRTICFDLDRKNKISRITAYNGKFTTLEDLDQFTKFFYNFTKRSFNRYMDPAYITYFVDEPDRCEISEAERAKTVNFIVYLIDRD